jgi:hypothetical protein
MKTIKDFLQATSDFADNSKIWVYFANRIFSDSEFQDIQKQFDDFSSQWKSHGAAMKNAMMIIENQIAIISVDESLHAISGCGIDSSVKIVKDIEQKYNISFFERNWVFFKEKEVLNKMQLSEFKTYCNTNIDIKVINPYFNNLKDIRTNFYSKIEDSLYKNCLKKQSIQ